MGSDTSFSSGKVVGTVLGAVPEGVKALIPTEANLKQQICRTQTAQQRVFISGTTAAELEIPHELTVDSNGLLFLQKDFHTIEGKRVLIFGTDSILNRVNQYQLLLPTGLSRSVRRNLCRSGLLEFALKE